MPLKNLTIFLITLSFLSLLTGCSTSEPAKSKPESPTTKERPNTNPTGYTAFTSNYSPAIFVADLITFSITGVEDVEGVKEIKLLVKKPDTNDYVVDPTADFVLNGESYLADYRIPAKGDYSFKIRFIDREGLVTDSRDSDIVGCHILPLISFVDVVAHPTESESITLKNEGSTTVDLSKYFIKDKGTVEYHPIPAGTVLAPGETVTFTHTQLRFVINNSGEILTLKNPAGYVINTWTN